MSEGSMACVTVMLACTAAILIIAFTEGKIPAWWNFLKALIAVPVEAVIERRDPLATALVKFQRQAERNLCYQTIYELEREIFGRAYTHPGTGKIASDDSQPKVVMQVNCMRQQCRKNHYKVLGW